MAEHEELQGKTAMNGATAQRYDGTKVRRDKASANDIMKRCRV